MLRTRGEMQDVVSKLAREDPVLARDLRRDPKATIEGLFGVTIPRGARIELLQESADTVYVVLPFSHDVGELSDDDLEAVAGGSTVVKEASADVTVFEAKVGE